MREKDIIRKTKNLAAIEIFLCCWISRGTAQYNDNQPGESLEECVQREVLEETGVNCPPKHVVYHSSQPWPFPSQLMLGAFAKAATEKIDITSRDKELEGVFPTN
jgi:hypothetical protein